MSDPIATGAAAVTIVTGWSRFLAWVKRHFHGHPTDNRLPGDTRAGLELRPFAYQLDLSGDVPRVRVEFLAINYTKKAIELRELKISHLSGSGHPALGSIDLDQEVTLQPKSSFLVFCSRSLADAEAKGSSSIKNLPVFTGSIAFVARGRVGRREIQYGPVAARTIPGSILNPPSGI